MNNNIKNQNGLTLLELLATITIVSIITILLSSIIVNAIDNNRSIKNETIMRDEADIIVSKLIKSLYSIKQTDIIRNTSDTNGNSYLEITSDLKKCQKDINGNLINEAECNMTLKPIGFKTVSDSTSIFILDEEYKISNKAIKISSSSKIIEDPVNSSIYEIVLTLQVTHSRGNKELTFTNKIQPIIQ